MTTLQELILTHNKELTKPYENESRKFSKEQVETFLEQARNAKDLYTAFFSIDAIVNRCDEFDEELKSELRKFEPILKLIKGINKRKPNDDITLQELYEKATLFFNNLKN